jgi:hypothetical protein
MRLAVHAHTKKHPARPRCYRCRLHVELLEERCLLSVQVLATLGTPVSFPTGTAIRINDFEPNAINNRGDVLYGNDLGTANDPSTFFGEGIFLRSHGQETVLASSTAPAPGGGTFDFTFFGPSTLNDQGDAALAFLLQPFPSSSPFGVNAGTYRFSHSTQTVTPVVVPGVTKVPQGGGTTFAGTFYGPSLNNRGELMFVGIVPTLQGIHLRDEPYTGLGLGIYQADATGHLSSVVGPGNKAPGGGTFDFADEPWVNDQGDMAFIGHVAGEEVRSSSSPPQAAIINALGSLYVKDGSTIKSIAHAGDPAPGGGVFRQVFGEVMNNQGDMVFSGDLTPAPDANMQVGVFRYSEGVITPIARPGDPMPGGGHLVTASAVPGAQLHLNNRGDVVFNCVLDTDVNHDGTLDTGLFEWSHGHLSLVARTGTNLPGVGTVKDLVMGVIVTPPPPELIANTGAINNDRGQILFGARLTDGRSVMLLETPKDPPPVLVAGSAVAPAIAGGGSVLAAALQANANHEALLVVRSVGKVQQQAVGPVTGPAASPTARTGLEAGIQRQTLKLLRARVGNIQALDQLFAELGLHDALSGKLTGLIQQQ